MSTAEAAGADPAGGAPTLGRSPSATRPRPHDLCVGRTARPADLKRHGEVAHDSIQLDLPSPAGAPAAGAAEAPAPAPLRPAGELRVGERQRDDERCPA